MNRLRGSKSLLLFVAAATLGGCTGAPAAKLPEARVPSATMSCVERSSTTIPPKHPIVELAWCIAEVNDLYDPNHLFQKMLGIKDYRATEGVTWGEKIAARAEANQNLPKGIEIFLFLRKNPSSLKNQGSLSLSFDVNPHVSCVRMEDISPTFGKEYWLSAVPLSVPTPSVAVEMPLIRNRELNPYGIFFKSPRLFMRDASGSVSFDFRYGECVVRVDIQRGFDFLDYKKVNERKK